MDVLKGVDLHALLGDADSATVREVESFIATGLPSVEDRGVQVWLDQNMLLQQDMTNLRSRVRHLLNMRQMSHEKLRARLIDEGLTTKKFKSQQEGELLLKSEEYEKSVSFLHELASLDDHVEQLSWILRNFAKKVNW